jgi:hypothetical protein
MADHRSVIVVSDGPVKDAAALHGLDIGYIWGYGNVSVVVDYARKEDGWVPITNPPTWRETGKVGWIKWARCAEENIGEVKLLITYYLDGRAPLVKVIG